MPASANELRAKVTIKSLDDVTTYHTYNPFNTASNDIHIPRVSISKSLHEIPQATIAIEDHENNLNENVINGCRVKIDLAKTDGSYTRYFSGLTRDVNVRRDDTGTFDLTLLAFGTGIRFNERISTFFRMANRTSFGSADPDSSDSNVAAHQVFNDLVTKVDHMPTGEPLESFSTAGIDTTITEYIPSIHMKFADWADIANKISDSVGADWGVDANDDVFFKYPAFSGSGLIIKDFDSAAYTTDTANTCYFIGGYSFSTSILKSQGFANRLFGRGGTEMTVDSFNTTSSTSTSIHDRDLAVKFIPGDSWNAAAMAVTLSKTGTPNPVVKAIQAVLRADSSGTPGRSIASANIPIGIIGSSEGQAHFGFSPSFVHLRNIQQDKAHWLQISRPGNLFDASNTINWHRDAGTSGSNAYRLAGGSWTVQNNSYKFTYGQLTSRQVLTVADDPVSIARYGVIEAVIDADWIIEGRTMDKYLSAILLYTAKPKRVFNIPSVTIPDVLPDVGEAATLIDSKTGFTTGHTTEILNTEISFNAYSHGLGANAMSLKLISYPPDEILANRI